MASEHALWHHDLRYVGLAVAVCVTGAWASSRFFRRMTEVGGVQRQAWLFLTALVGGVTMWCTHVIGLLGYEFGAVDFDDAASALSLLVAVVGSAIGFRLAGRGSERGPWTLIGGAIVGVSLSGTHYLLMQAVSTSGSRTWSTPLVVESVVATVALSALAPYVGRFRGLRGANGMWGLFALTVVALDVLGMAALSVRPASATAGAAYLVPSLASVQAVAVAVLSIVTISAGIAGYLIDDRTRASSVERLRRLAMYDVLTTLPNRAYFNERLEGEIVAASQHGTRLAMIVVDIDNFKEINDVRGHNVGDAVLRRLGHRLDRLADARPGSFIGRIGGDEFVAIFPMTEGRDLHEFLDSIDREIVRPMDIVGTSPISSRASVGVAVFPDDAPDAEGLVNNADLAMYRAKGDPTLTICFYDAEVDEQTRLRRGLVSHLREAVANDELYLHYQVQRAVATDEIRGYEALLRWRHPELGVISPGEFIPLAEESGLIVEIGEWVLRTASAEAARWEPPYRVSVNVSAVQLAQPEFVQSVRDVLGDTGLAAGRLELELTETAVFTDRDRALEALREIKDLGVGIALDDFGVGYSSLDALRSFPFDRIKIDRSFFSGAGTPEQTMELVRVVLLLGHTFGMSVLAEGIETEDQLAMISATGCEDAQGFLFGHPLPVEEILRSGQVRQLPEIPHPRTDVELEQQTT